MHSVPSSAVPLSTAEADSTQWPGKQPSDLQRNENSTVYKHTQQANIGQSEQSEQSDQRWHWQSGPLGIHHHYPIALLERRNSSGRRRSSVRRKFSLAIQRAPATAGGLKWWKFHFREWDDEDEQDWWFASTAIPLLAATIGPLANVLSIAALVTSWRMCVVTTATRGLSASVCQYDGDPSTLGPQLDGHSFPDPRWSYWLNVVSLIVGFVGNFFLLCNFTNRIRYIIALPVTILCWYIATGLLTGITLAMHVWVPPTRPQQTYTQGFWYAVIAACMYMICAMLLMVNMLGYFLGHYPQHFTLTDSQRTLILQTMLFFVWLAGGGAVFSAVESRFGDGRFTWSYVNSLYFCDVTILTVGFGDLYPTSDIGRGIVFPYSVGGIIMLGLMVSSIARFAKELGSEKIIQRHFERSRARTVGRAVTTSLELEHRRTLQEGERPVISAPFNPIHLSKERSIGFVDGQTGTAISPKRHILPRPTSTMKTVQRVGTMMLRPPRTRRTPRLILLREEKDRFNEMRRIQTNTSRFKNWYALLMSVSAFGVLWCLGALVFYYCERETQDMTYFRALYFCYVSLLTIGYGDLSPTSNAGRPFFVFWSLIAVPTMTILVSDLGDTVINKFKKGTSGLADFTVLPQRGVYRNFLNRFPSIVKWLQQRKERKAREKRIEAGFLTGPGPEEPDEEPPTLDELAKDEVSDRDLARRLAKAIRRVAKDSKEERRKRYTYEEWVEFTQLIRFTVETEKERGKDEEYEGMNEWDWIGEDSPMMSGKSEADFVFDRLCESMDRYVKETERVLSAGISRTKSGEGEGTINVEQGVDEQEQGGDDIESQNIDLEADAK